MKKITKLKLGKSQIVKMRHWCILLFTLFMFFEGPFVYGQCDSGFSEIFITTSGGNWVTEKWVSITTEANGEGTQVWGQGNGALGNQSGLLNNVPICLPPGIYYVNCYDAYDDGWDGTMITVLAYGALLGNNGGLSPNDGTDEDNSSAWEDAAIELETSFMIEVPEPPTCFPPSSLGILDITAYSAKAIWTNVDGPFEIEWGLQGFELGTGELMGDSGNTFTIEGLDPITQYQYYVRKDCGDEYSLWAGPFSFTTLCAPFDVPTILETFSTFTGTAPVGLACWSEAVGALDSSLTGTSSTWTYDNYNVNIDASGGVNGRSAYINLYGTDNEWLISPQIDLGDGTVPYQLEYEVSITPWTGGANLTDIGEKFVKVVVSTDGGLTWSADNVIATYDNNNIPNGGREETIALNGYSGLVKIGFYAYSTSTAIDTRFYIDNFKISNFTTCSKPNQLTSGQLTADSAILSWSSDGTTFDIEIGENGFAPTGIPTNAEVTNNYFVDGLSPVTTYQYYVRQNCGDETSNWAGPYSFMTGTIVSSLNFSEGFEGENLWALSNSSSLPNKWHVGNATNNGGTKALYISNDDGVSNAYTTLTSVTVVHAYTDIAVDSGVGVVNFSFNWKGMGENTDTAYDYFRVWLVPVTFTPTVGTQITAGTGRIQIPGNFYRQSDWQNYVDNNLNISSFANGNMRLVFEWRNDGSDGSGEGAAIDNVSIVVPTCPMPINLDVTDITHDSVVLNWSSTGTTFDVEYGENGFVPTGVPTLLGVANNYLLNTGLNQATSYQFYVRQDCDVNGYSTWAGPFRFRTECLPPNVTSVNGAEICGLGTVELSATGDGQSLAWYASEVGGVKLSEGVTFTTPTITETTSYWVEAKNGNTANVGPESPTAHGGDQDNWTIAWAVNFTVHEPTVLMSLDVFPVTSGQTGSIALRQGTGSTNIATVPFTTTVSGGNTAQTIDLNFVLEPGTYNLYPTLPSSGLRRNTSGGSYPYASEIASITGNGYLSTYYMGFYRWVLGAGCSSERTEVVATVTTAPEFTLSVDALAICNGETSDLVTITTGAANYDTFEWEPAQGVSGDEITGWTFNPSVSTTYLLNVSQSTGAECMTNATIEVVINPLPNVIEIVSSSDEACQNTVFELSVSGNIVNGTAVFGNGTTAPGATSWPNPFSKWYGGTKHQLLYTADELSAQGLVAGSEITAITFDLAAVNITANGACTDFTIRMGATSVTQMTGLVSGTIDVYGPATFAPTVAEVVSFTLTTPYVWDGISNLIVETVHNTGNGGSGSGTTTRTSSTPLNTVYRVANDNVSGGVSGFDALTTYTTSGAHNIRPNMTFIHTMEHTMITWSPTTDLYADVAATIPYLADSYASTVYFKPTTIGEVSYTATSNTDLGCSISDTATITVNASPDMPIGGSFQIMNEGQLISDLLVDGSNLVWYSDASLSAVIEATTELENEMVYYVTQSNGTCESLPLAITVEITMGTKDNFDASFTYYPNPVSSILNLSYDKTITNVAVYNVLGQQVMNIFNDRNNIELSMNHLPNGAYLLKIHSNDQVKVIKVIKQ
jgi:hypothetical protein